MNFTVHPNGFVPQTTAGRKLRYDVEPLVKEAVANPDSWVSVDLAEADASSAMRQLKEYADIKYASAKIDEKEAFVPGARRLYVQVPSVQD